MSDMIDPIDEGREPEVVFDEDNPEWTEEDFARAQPASSLAPEILAAFPHTKRGPQRAPTKRQVTLRLSPEVLDRFRATGKGWQTRIDQALREHLGL